MTIHVHVNYVPGYDQIGVWLYETWANDNRYRYIATSIEENGYIIFEQEEENKRYEPLLIISGRSIDEFAVAMTEALKKFLPKEEPVYPINPVMQEALDLERLRVNKMLDTMLRDIS